jgi:uncharacterized membrane protein (DUF485 family)
MAKQRTESNWINWLLWGIYILLLMVLLPHTAWMFARAESTEPGEFGISWGLITAWSAATVFELVIAAMTHKLSKHISNTPRFASGWKRFKARYLNAYGAGLSLAWIVSTYANLAHAVEFGQPIKIFAAWGLPVWSYSVAFGAILPTASLLFAWVLSSVIEQDGTEHQLNPELDRANMTIRELRERLRSTEQERISAEQRANEAEVRFSAAGDMFARLVSTELKERVLFARQRWPELPQSAIAVIAQASPARVSEIIAESKSTNG